MTSTRRLRSASVVACILALLGLAACSDDDGGDNNNSVVDAAVDAAQDAATGESMTFVVLTTTDGTDVPVEGAAVAFDAPGGERSEQTTGADGRVTFDNIDWSQGSAAVTAYLLGYSLASTVNLDATSVDPADLVDGAVPLHLYDLEPDLPAELTITGSATGMVDPAHEYTVNVLFSPVATEDTAVAGTGSYSITAPSGEPFTIQALERDMVTLPSGQGYAIDIYRVMHQPVAPITADTTIDLDFAAFEVPTYTADASMYLPTRAESPLRSGNGVALVCSENSLYCFGWGQHVDISSDGNHFNITVIWTEPSLAENPFAYYRVYNRISGETSLAYIPGYPQGGVVDPPLLDVPHILVPAFASTVHPVHERMEWEWFDADIPYTGVRIVRSGTVVWYVVAGPNATSATVPLPPTGAATSSILGTNPTAVIYGVKLDPVSGTRLVLSRAQRISP